jgi:Bacterial extracellular solute-binding protein
MGRHSRDEEPAPRRPDRPYDPSRPVNGPAPGRSGPREYGRPRQPSRPPVAASQVAAPPRPIPPKPPPERPRPVEEDPSTVTGSHRAIGKAAGRRRIAAWPLVAGAFVVLVVVGLLGWGWANNVLNSRAEAQANACTEGDSTLKVLVTPSLDKPVNSAAAKWNQAHTVVHAHCVHITVQSAPSTQVLAALTGKANLDSIGGLPAAWIPENSYWISQLQTAEPAMIGSPAESVASAPSADYPFVGLAGASVDEVQARAAQVFRDFLKEPAQQAEFTNLG